MPGSSFTFGAFRYDPEFQQLTRDGTRLALGRRGVLVLEALLRRRGAIVPKRDLVEAAWPGLAIEESNLSVQVAKLRRLIGADWIRTVERIGYQFIDPPPAAASSPMAKSEAPTLLIVPLRHGDGRHGGAHTLDDELVAALARYRTLRFATGEPGSHGLSDPAIPYRLATSVREHIGGPPRATLRLIESASGSVLWAQSFAVIDFAAAAENIAASVVSELRAAELRHSLRHPANGAEAYHHYLRARLAMRSSRADDNAVALSHLRQAIALEPECATYLAAAAEATHHRLAVGWQTLASDDRERSRELTRRAHAVAGNDAESLAVIGTAMFTIDEEDLGLELTRRANRMNPANLLVLVCAGLAEIWGGSVEEAERLHTRALSLAPHDAGQRFAAGGLATIARLRGDHAGALAWARRSLVYGPGFSGAHWNIVNALGRLGRRPEAERHLARYFDMAPGVTVRSIEAGQHFADRSRLASLVEGLRAAGMPER